MTPTHHYYSKGLLALCGLAACGAALAASPDAHAGQFVVTGLTATTVTEGPSRTAL